MRPNGWLYKIILLFICPSLRSSFQFYLGSSLIQFPPPENVTLDFQKEKENINKFSKPLIFSTDRSQLMWLQSVLKIRCKTSKLFALHASPYRGVSNLRTTFLNRYAENLRNRLNQIPGSSQLQVLATRINRFYYQNKQILARARKQIELDLRNTRIYLIRVVLKLDTPRYKGSKPRVYLDPFVFSTRYRWRFSDSTDHTSDF